MQELRDDSTICNELVDSLSRRLEGKTFKDEEALINHFLGNVEDCKRQFNLLNPTYQQQVKERLWIYYQKPYMRKILDCITPEYFSVEKKVPGSNTKSPVQLIKVASQTEGLTRILDMLPNKDLFTAKEIDTFLQNLLSYGNEFALAQILNPLLSEIIDFDKQTLKQAFINKNLGQDVYQTLKGKELADQKIAYEFCGAFKMLIANVIVDNYQQHPLQPCYTTLSGKQQGTQNSAKLFDNKKYHFCQEMSDEITKFLDKDIIESISFELESLKETYPQFKSFLGNPENQQKVEAHFLFSRLIKHLEDLNKKPEKNAATIQEIEALIQKYDYDNYNYQKNCQQLPIVSRRLSLSVGAAFFGTALATFGAGATLIPFASAAVIGLCSSIYNGYMSRTLNKAIESFESVALKEAPQDFQQHDSTFKKVRSALEVGGGVKSDPNATPSPIHDIHVSGPQRRRSAGSASSLDSSGNHSAAKTGSTDSALESQIPKKN